MRQQLNHPSRCTALHVLGALAACGLAGLTACGAGEGSLSVEIWGEDFIESGIPAAQFADGWAVTFAHFVVNVGAVAVAHGAEAPALAEASFRLFDLATADGPQAFATVTAPAAAYDNTAYTLAPATAASVAVNAAQAQVTLMRDNGYTVYVAGSATDGVDTVSFAWGFGGTTRYHGCESTAQLAADGQASVQLTIHGDHLFYDDAVSSEPALRFADIALADADSDGEVTPAELEAYELAPLAHYGVGSLDIDNLWEFMAHMTATLGHIDGEGHCHF